jgi:hypothetical protein
LFITKRGGKIEMEKKIISIVLGLLLFATTISVAETQISDENNSSSVSTNDTNRDMWDVQFQYDVGGLSGSLYLGGTIFDGTYFYCPEWNSATIYRFDKDGTYLDSFTISGVSSLRDLTYDGTYMYGGNGAGSFLWEMDFTTQTLVSTISTAVPARSCAYDEDADGFWVNVWDSNLVLLDRTGAIIDSMTAPESLYGSEWDPWTQISGYDGPFLWIFTGTSTGVNGVIKVIDLATKTLVPGVSHDVAAELGMGIAGGLGFTTEYIAGTATLYGIIQGTSPIDDYLFGYEIAITNPPPETPTKPSGPTTGQTGKEYTFTTSSTDPDEEDIYIKFDWGDETYSDWLGPYPSGTTVSGKNIWTTAGTYEVKAKAKDIVGGESEWSEPHTITIEELPDLQIRNIGSKFGRITVDIKNTGTVDVNDIKWTITLEGGLIILGQESEGTIPSLKAGFIADFESKFILGFGKPTVTVKLEVEDLTFEETVQASVFFFFVKIT